MLRPALIAASLIAPSVASAATLEASLWGRTPQGQPVTLYTLRNDHGMSVRISSYGALITDIATPDRDNHPGSIVLGLPSLRDVIARNATYHFGGFIGRFANRIAHAQFTLNGHIYRLQANEHGNTLHGGAPGYDRVLYAAKPGPSPAATAQVTLSRRSPAGEQGFPGNLQLSVTYTLSEDALRIDYAATTDADTVVNFTNHSYFNLAGNGAGAALDTVLQIAADRYTPTDAASIPTGEIAPVAGTPLDFRTPTPLAARVRDAFPQLLYPRGYDNNWVLDHPPGQLGFAARAWDPHSGRLLDCFTTEPGLQVYTANSLDGGVVGSSGGAYRQGDAFTLETQHFPDSPHHPNFHSTLLKAGQSFHSTTLFRFATSPGFPPLTPAAMQPPAP